MGRIHRHRSPQLDLQHVRLIRLTRLTRLRCLIRLTRLRCLSRLINLSRAFALPFYIAAQI